MIFYAIGSFFSFILIKYVKRVNVMNAIAACFIFPIHILCYFVFKNTRPGVNEIDDISYTASLCYIIYGLSSGLLFSTTLSMVGLTVKPLDVGKSFALFWSNKVVELFVEILFH